MSRQIQDLERDLRVRLFDRIGRQIVLTGDGGELLAQTRRLLADIEAFQGRAHALAQAGQGIAIVPSVVKLDLSRIALAGLDHDRRPLRLWARVAWDSRRYLPSYASEFVEGLVRYMKRSYPGHRLNLARSVPRPRDALVR